MRQSGAGPTCKPGGGWGAGGAWAVGIEVQASDTKVEMVGPDVCCPAGEAGITALPSQTRRGNTGGAKFSGLRSMQELLVSYGFAEEWLGRRAGPKADWDRAVATAVLGRAAAETSAAIAEHRSLIGFVPHPGGISRYLDDRSNSRGTRMVTKVRLGHLMVLIGDSGSYAALAIYPGQVRAMLRRD